MNPCVLLSELLYTLVLWGALCGAVGILIGRRQR